MIPVLIVDALTGETLPGAHLVLLGSDLEPVQPLQGVVTDPNGAALVGRGRYRVSFVGYVPQVVQVEGHAFTVQMEPGAVELEPHTVTAYRSQRWPLLFLLAALME